MSDCNGRIFFIRAVREATVHVFKPPDIQVLREHWGTAEVQFNQNVLNSNYILPADILSGAVLESFSQDSSCV